MIPPELTFSRRRRLPMFHGAETAECGLACLAMIAVWHGHELDLNALRQRFSLSMLGVSLRGLMDLADRLDLSSRALRVELEALSQVQTPAILHWDLDHFVVLKRCGPKGVVIHDPSAGVRSLTWVEASSHFTGIVLELTPAAHFQPVRDRNPTTIRSLWSRIDGFWTCAAQVLGLSLALQILAFAGPFFLQLVVDQGVLRGDLHLLYLLAGGYAALILLQGSVEACRAWTLQVVGQLANFQITGNLVRHLLRVRADYFEKRHLGDIISRLGSAKVLQDLLTKGILVALLDGVMAVAALVLLFVYSPLLAWVVLGSLVLYLALAMAAYPSMRERTEKQLAEAAAEQSFLMETVRAASIIRLLGREPEREGLWRNAYARVINASVSVAKWQISLQLAQTLITGLQTALVVLLGARATLQGEGFSVGMLIAFLALRQTFTDRATGLVSQALQFRLLTVHLERLGDIVQAEPDVDSRAPPVLLSEVTGAMQLRGVHFQYGSVDRPILSGIDLDVSPGEFLAITGTSGGGKSTLLKLMLGLHRPTGGRVYLEGREATPELYRAWRESVGVVAQDDRLLSGSLADNIAFFDPQLDMARVVEAARAALIHDDINCMPMQYASLIGDMGSALSGGQRQRVLLARALYRQPRILILDEGTANLDVATELQLANLIAAMPITRIVVAHRPALLERADRVLIVEEGRLPPSEAPSGRRGGLELVST